MQKQTFSILVILILLQLFSCSDNPTEPFPDYQPPIIEWLAPDVDEAISGEIELKFSISDTQIINSVNVYRNGKVPTGWTFADHTDDVYSLNWDTRTVMDGQYALEVRAKDASGNLGLSPTLLVKVMNENPEDLTPPLVTWIYPEAGDVVEGEVDLTFSVVESDTIASIGIFLDGEKLPVAGLQYQNDTLMSYKWNSTEVTDGKYELLAAAFDRSGNFGMSIPVSITVLNHPDLPRVIWVPDDFESIQGAIWASENGDTIMVRAGTYREQLQFFDKNVSLVSEDGPEETIIDGTGYYTCAWVTGGQDTTMMIRGFTFRNESQFDCFCIALDGSSPKVVNNIFIADGYAEQSGVSVGHNSLIIRNNLFYNLGGGLRIAHSWGDASNNMFVTLGRCIFNRAINGQPLAPDYNLFWQYVSLFGGSELSWGEHNIEDQEPLFAEGSFRLRINSPGVDQGRPDILDLDDTRSDIGIYGGPYAYTNP